MFKLVGLKSEFIRREIIRSIVLSAQGSLSGHADQLARDCFLGLQIINNLFFFIEGMVATK